MGVTIKDIARACEVDVSTVSRALRDDPRVREATRLRIKEEARRVGYRPNLAAQNLVAGRTRTIWMMVPSLHTTIEQEPSQHASVYLANHQYDLMVVLHQSDPTIFARLVSRLTQGAADGAIIIPGPVDDRGTEVRPLLDINFPMVFFDRHPRYVDIPRVTNDNAGSAAELVRKAYWAGARGLLLLEHHDNSAAEERREGALSTAVELGMAIHMQHDDEPLPNGKKLPEHLAIMSSSQGRIFDFLHTHPQLAKDHELTFCMWDNLFGEPYPAKTAFVAKQDLKTMAERASDLVLQLAKGLPHHQTDIAVPALRYEEIRLRL